MILQKLSTSFVEFANRKKTLNSNRIYIYCVLLRWVTTFSPPFWPPYLSICFTFSWLLYHMLLLLLMLPQLSPSSFALFSIRRSPFYIFSIFLILLQRQRRKVCYSGILRKFHCVFHFYGGGCLGSGVHVDGGCTEPHRTEPRVVVRVVGWMGAWCVLR